MRSKLLLPILVLAAIVGLALLIPCIVPAGEIPSAPHYKVLSPIGHGNLTVFPVVATTSHDTQEFLTLDEGLRSGDVVVSESGNLAPLVRPRHGFRPTRYNPGDGAQVDRLVLVNNSKRPWILLGRRNRDRRETGSRDWQGSPRPRRERSHRSERVLRRTPPLDGNKSQLRL